MVSVKRVNAKFLRANEVYYERCRDLEMGNGESVTLGPKAVPRLKGMKQKK